MINNSPCYLNWDFWTVIIAFAALILSQLPPIHILIKRAKIDFELHSKIFLGHKVGNPNLQMNIIINNIGGRTVKIKKISGTIFKDKKEIITLPVQNFLQNPTDLMPTLFTSISINRDDDWNHIINLLNFFDRKDEKQYWELQKKLKNDIRNKLSEGKNSNDENQGHKNFKNLVVAEENNYLPFIDFFNKKFIWHSGEYNLEVKVTTNSSDIDISKTYRFTIFDSQEEDLKDIVESYKYGEGIFFETEKFWFGIDINEL